MLIKLLILVVLTAGFIDAADTWTQIGPPNGGCIPDIYPHPTDSNTVYCNGDVSGLWKSIDAGESWQHCGFRNGTHLMYLAFDAVDPEILYMAVYDGVFRSMNGGEDWSMFATCAEVGYEPIEGPTQEGEMDNEAHVSMPMLITEDHIFISLNYPDSTSSNPSVWGQISVFSFADSSWNKQISTTSTDRIRDFQMIGDTLFACSHSGIYRSSNFGSTWETLLYDSSGYCKAMELESFENTLYVYSCETDGESSYPYARIYYSDDMGESWSLLKQFDGFHPGKDAFLFYHIFDINPITGTMIAGCMNNANMTFSRSTDGGASWNLYAPHTIFWDLIDKTGQIFQRCTYGLGGVHSIKASPCSDSWFICGSNNIIGSSNDGCNWEYRVEGILNSGFHCIRRCSINPDYLIGGQTDNELTYSVDGGETWLNYSIACNLFEADDMWGGSLIYLEFDPWEPGEAYALFTLGGRGFSQGGAGNRYLARIGYGVEYVESLHHFPDIVDPDLPDNCIGHRMVLGNNQNEIFVATVHKSAIDSLETGLLRSTDGGYAFENAEHGLGISGNGITPGFNRVTGLVRNENGDIYLTLNDDSFHHVLYEWNSAECSWDSLYILPQRVYFSRSEPIACGSDTGHLLINTLSESGSDTLTTVMQTFDNGASWDTLWSSDSAFVSAMYISPENPSEVWVNWFAPPFTRPDSRWGLYRSLDGGGSWEQIQTGMIRNRIRCFQYDYTSGWLWTAMKGTCIAWIPGTTQSILNELNSICSDFSIFPNPAEGSISIEFILSSPHFTELSVYDLAGRRVAGLSRGVLESGVHSFIWDGILDTGGHIPSGLYFCTLTAGEQVQSRSIVIIH